MVVMDEVDDMNQLRFHATQGVVENLRRKLDSLHNTGLVHGDIRNTNVLVKDNALC